MTINNFSNRNWDYNIIKYNNFDTRPVGKKI